MDNKNVAIDKHTWGDGPWRDEPDELEFESSGLSCYVCRGPHSGSFNGYVALPTGHPCYGKAYDDIKVEVHGGLTYADAYKPMMGAHEGKMWWVGFDTAHCCDLMPAIRALLPPSETTDIYRDINYVRAETEKLAKQLANYDHRS